MAHLRRHNGKFCQRLSLSKKPFCQAGGRGSKLSTIRNGHPAAPSGLQCSLAHWAYFALLRPQGARFVRPPPLPHPQFAMVAPLRSQARLRLSLAYWAYYGLLPPLAAAFVRPYQFPLKSYGFSGAETARKRFLLWKMGFSDAVYCEPMHPSIQHGRSTALASSLAVLPASLGLLRAVSPTGRALRAPPPYTPPGTIEVRKGFALLSRSPLSFLTVCGNGKFCQRLFRCMRSAKSSLCLGDFFLFNRTNLRGFDIS